MKEPLDHVYEGCQQSRTCHYVLKPMMYGAEICGRPEKEHPKATWFQGAVDVDLLREFVRLYK